MGRILAIDYGRKRCGLAVTDVLQICANGLPTVRACDLVAWLKDYCGREDVDLIVMGHPRTVHGEDSESMRYIAPALKKIKAELPGKEIVMYDERFTSVIANRAKIEGGMKRSQRQRKEISDEMAAVILLTDYLNSSLHKGL